MDSNEDILSKLPNQATREALLEIIETKIPTKDYKLHLESGSAKGDNYIGITLRLTITYNDEEMKHQALGIFIKVAPDNPQRRLHFFVRPCFLRETLMYNEYLPLLKKFQQFKGISVQDEFRAYSACFSAITSDTEEAIFMEDLCLKGYTMYDRFAEPSADMVKMLMRTLGKFHALSFAVKDQWPEEFFKYTQLEEILCSKDQDPKFKNYVNNLEKVAFDALSDKCYNQELQRLKEFFKSKGVLLRSYDCVSGAKAEPYAVVCHGDCWNNNFLFKYQDKDLLGIKLIDWQLARYSSPVTDLVYYLFSCTTGSLRAEYYTEFLDTYYTELSTFLQRLGSDPSVVFPRPALDKQLKEFAVFGFLMGLMVIPTITLKKEDVPDLDEVGRKMDEGDEEFTAKAFANNQAETTLKIRDMILDMLRLGYIQ